MEAPDDVREVDAEDVVALAREEARGEAVALAVEMAVEEAREEVPGLRTSSSPSKSMAKADARARRCASSSDAMRWASSEGMIEGEGERGLEKMRHCAVEMIAGLLALLGST